MIEFNPAKRDDVLNQMKNVFDIRKKMVESSIEVGISETARIYGTTRKTVRKWLNRYKRYGISGLEDLSRAPKSSPLKMSKEEEKKIIEIRRFQPYLGAMRIREEHPALAG